MKGDYKENFKKSITELTSEFEPFIKESQIKENSINNKLQSFQEKLIEKVKGNVVIHICGLKIIGIL